MMMGMGAGILAAIAELEKENANLQPELLTAERARELMTAYARAGKLVSFGIAALSRKLDDSSELARLTGSSVGRAKNVVTTGAVMASSEELSSALMRGDISLDQAHEIATAEESAPGAAKELVAVAQEHPSTCYGTRRAKPSWRPSSVVTSVCVSIRPAGHGTTQTRSAWCTSTWSSSLISVHP